MHFVLFLFRLRGLRDALVEEYLQGYTAKEEQGRGEEDKSRRVLAGYHQTDQTQHLEGQEDQSQVNGQAEEQLALSFAFLNTDRSEFVRQFEAFEGSSDRFRLFDLTILGTDTVQQRASKALVQEEAPRCYHLEELS